MRVGAFGATSQVGDVMHKLLAERNYPADEIRYFASEHSMGKVLPWGDREVVVEDIAKAGLHDIDVALFPADGGTSEQWVPEVVRAGATVIDNSSIWCMDPHMPLIISQANPEDVDKTELGIIANPNYITMAAAPATRPLHGVAGLEAMQITTLQVVSGSGISGVRTFAGRTRQADDPQVLVHDGPILTPPDLGSYIKPIAFNALPQAGSSVDDDEDETDERKKLRNESRKILRIPRLLVAGTCVHTPVFAGHSLSIRAQFSHPITLDETHSLLTGTSGAELSEIPTPPEAAGKNPSYVSRTRRDQSVEDGTGLVLFVSDDNLRKGAALNAIRAAELLVR